MSSGEHPMADPPSGDDACHVRKPAARYDEQQDACDRVARERFGRQGPLDSVAETRTLKVDQLRDRIARAEYRVDSRAVAEAIIARLTAGGSVSDGARSRSNAPRPPLR
jgi:anti-sigma28 factor (negative regulator of flagellin synthesis)